MLRKTEELMGLRAVPQAHNFAEGSIYRNAAKSWMRRALEREVPGMTGNSEIENRLRRMQEMDDLTKAELYPVTLEEPESAESAF